MCAVQHGTDRRATPPARVVCRIATARNAATLHAATLQRCDNSAAPTHEHIASTSILEKHVANNAAEEERARFVATHGAAAVDAFGTTDKRALKKLEKKEKKASKKAAKKEKKKAKKEKKKEKKAEKKERKGLKRGRDGGGKSSSGSDSDSDSSGI
jgi:hypothetical protein